LNHRIKNTLAVVKLIAQQTFKSGEVGDAARRSFEGRLAALGAAHDLVSRTNWEKASLADVEHDAVAFCGPALNQIGADGSLVMLGARQALAITMGLHELSTS
jgi:two-component sensor histidine kinase